jgi:hypothetical protein
MEMGHGRWNCFLGEGGGIVTSKIYLGTILGTDGYYYKGVFEFSPNMLKVAESIGYGGPINALAQDDNYIYVGGATTQKVYKLNKSNLTKVAESDNYGGTIYALAQDDNYIYVGGQTAQKVYKFNKSNLTKVAESDNYGGHIWALAQENNYIYVGGATARVYKYEGNLYTLAGYRRVE